MPDDIYKQLTLLQKQIDNLIKPEIFTISELGNLFLLRANNLSDVASDVTSFDNIKQAATDAYTGVVELATQAEVDAGTDTTRVVTPATLANYPMGLPHNGRLTLTSGTAVLTSDVTAATTIYFTPYLGNRIALYTGSFWQMFAFSQISIAVPSTVYRLFDIYVYNNAGTLTLETVNWNQSTAAITGATNATPIVITSNGHGLNNNDYVAIAGVLGNTAANGIWSVTAVAANTFTLEGSAGSGAYTAATGTWYKLNATRATAITLQNGRYVQSGATDRLYLGTGMTTGTSGQTEVSAGNLLLWNYFNRVASISLSLVDVTNHTYTSATTRVYRGQNSLKVGFVVGVVEDLCSMLMQTDVNFDAGDGAVSVGLVQNRTGALALQVSVRDVLDSRGLVDYAPFTPAGAGYNFVQLTQSGAATSPDFRLALARGFLNA